MSYRDQIYFLPVKHPATFDGGSFSPVSDYDEIAKAMSAGSNPDGFLYPPIQETVRQDISDPEGKSERVPGTIRPAAIYQLPASHTLEVTETLMGEFRQEDGAFLMHLAAYLYGYRLQFHDWWIDGRVPMRSSTHHVLVPRDTANRFFSMAYQCWRRWGDSSRRYFINILFMHSRAPGYQWNWESFTFEYMVLDALYKHANQNYGVTASGHGKRIQALSSKFDLWKDEATVREIVNLRNGLQHEALWRGNQPGSTFDTHAHGLTHCLRCFNQRLIPAILGFKGEYTSSDWTAWIFRHLFK